MRKIDKLISVYEITSETVTLAVFFFFLCDIYCLFMTRPVLMITIEMDVSDNLHVYPYLRWK